MNLRQDFCSSLGVRSPRVMQPFRFDCGTFVSYRISVSDCVDLFAQKFAAPLTFFPPYLSHLTAGAKTFISARRRPCMDVCALIKIYFS